MESVSVREDFVELPTYEVGPPDKNPMFLERRVYQGSTGKVYPNAFTDRVSSVSTPKRWRAIHLENEYVYLMILPEIGGRIHIGRDKTNGYDFFYRQDVIKPALVGLLGPWISGGVEFNWPQHHRPSTYMPVQHAIERADDGSVTVWLSEHEPMNRMKGMVGICLHPGSALVEAKIQIYNRTPFTQTFLWWANVGVRVHDNYEAVFPPDVTFVADHAKRAVTEFPVAKGRYYGVDYSPGTDLRWYKNIPVPTSYMVTESEYDFFGGYDHSARAGFIHVADRHIAPGKKLWTWGNSDFGYAWDRELTDTGGPYIELMAGVFTDNQPDFSWLAPYETKLATQCWYPVQSIGPASNATREAAVSLAMADGQVSFGVSVTRPHASLRVQIFYRDRVVLDNVVAVRPGQPYLSSWAGEEHTDPGALRILVTDEHGSELVGYRAAPAGARPLPSPATEPAAPGEIGTNDELYLTGLHLLQYRHATRYPELYWQEALRRDLSDLRSNTALGELHLRRGEFDRAELYLRRAIATATARNPNPHDGDAFYHLGLTLEFQDRLEDAYAMFSKATWNYAWRSAAHYALARICSKQGRIEDALSHLKSCLEQNTRHSQARNLLAALLRRQGRPEIAADLSNETLRLDPLDTWAECEVPSEHGSKEPACHSCPQVALDVAFDYASAGLWKEASDTLLFHFRDVDHIYPMVAYTLAWLARKQNESEKEKTFLDAAAESSTDYCFPARLEEQIVLEYALKANPRDGRAAYFYGNLLYDKRRYAEASAAWEKATGSDPENAIAWRNLGIASFNILREPKRALDAYERAFSTDSKDARLFYELDQLRKQLGETPEARLSRLELQLDLVAERDDMTVEYVALLNSVGRHGDALAVLMQRRFHPWEGGEGLVSGQYVLAHTALARQHIHACEFREALAHVNAARNYPHNLGEGKSPLLCEANLDVLSGLCHQGLRGVDDATTFFQKASVADTTATPEMMYWQTLALQFLGNRVAAAERFGMLSRAAHELRTTPPRIDYFATSLPHLLLFDTDTRRIAEAEGCYLEGLVCLASQRRQDAAKNLQCALDLDPSHNRARIELALLSAAGTDGAERPAATS